MERRFAAVPSVAVNGLLSLLIGVGQGGIEVTVNTAVVRMERAGEHHLMGRGHAAFSTGAIVGPLTAAAVLAADLPWQAVYRILGAALLLSAVLQLFL